MRKITYLTDQNHPQIQSYKEAVDKGQSSQHVLPRDGSWVVKRAGSTNVSRVFQTQEEARKAAETIAKNQGSSMFVHGRDGRIRDRKDF